ncbi:hypothetical protein Bsp3421_003108 [Burkholderia sp. FERM BP-3421]|jgi:hypothetical protein|nr:hypothetical protein [Burkholderia sp. FERM BP-3421]WDD93061.1 hypothetical protein Bsp3421_003108 [Burkholderia sp. FERM BP-3421]
MTSINVTVYDDLIARVTVPHFRAAVTQSGAPWAAPRDDRETSNDFDRTP